MWWPGILKDYIDIYGDDMTGALVILAFTVVVGLGLYLWDVAWRKKHPAQGGNPDADGQTDVTAADEARPLCRTRRHVVYAGRDG